MSKLIKEYNRLIVYDNNINYNDTYIISIIQL